MNVANTVDDWRAAQIKLQRHPEGELHRRGFWRPHRLFLERPHAQARRRLGSHARSFPATSPKRSGRAVEPVETLPAVINPKAGYVVNANHTPFLSSGAGRQSEAPRTIPPRFARRHQPHQSRPARAGTVRLGHLHHARGIHRLQDGPQLFDGLDHPRDDRGSRTGRHEGRRRPQGCRSRCSHPGMARPT